eukprot:909507-Amphidinium_carterae.3
MQPVHRKNHEVSILPEVALLEEMAAPATTSRGNKRQHEDIWERDWQWQTPLTAVGGLTNRAIVTRAIVRGDSVHKDLQVGGRPSAQGRQHLQNTVKSEFITLGLRDGPAIARATQSRPSSLQAPNSECGPTTV